MIFTNQLKKYVKSLHLLKYRQKYNKFIAEGPKICSEFIQFRPQQIEYLFCTEDWIVDHPSETATLSGKIIKCKEKELQSISKLSTANKILIVLEQELTYFNNTSFQNEWVLYLDELKDPGNMGTMIRIADWFNVKYLMSSPDSVDYFNPKVVQSAMGSHTRVHLLYASLTEVNLDNLYSYALVMNGEKLTHDLAFKPGIIIVGNESRGVSKEIESIASRCLTIDRLGGAESLNASVACGIACSMMIK
jgi:TrmH family RNA methyltransferase